MLKKNQFSKILLFCRRADCYGNSELHEIGINFSTTVAWEDLIKRLGFRYVEEQLERFRRIASGTITRPMNSSKEYLLAVQDRQS